MKASVWDNGSSVRWWRVETLVLWRMNLVRSPLLDGWMVAGDDSSGWLPISLFGKKGLNGGANGSTDGNTIN